VIAAGELVIAGFTTLAESPRGEIDRAPGVRIQGARAQTLSI
jgi:hypothetical protein